MQVCLFEDSLCQHLNPLLLTRPADDLRTGILTIYDKWKYALKPDRVSRLLRSELDEVFETGTVSSADSCYWVNARYLPTENLVEEIKDIAAGTCIRSDSTVIAGHVDGHISATWFEKRSPDFSTLSASKATGFLSVEHPWDLFLMNGEQIRRDIHLLQPQKSSSVSISEHAVLECEQDIYIEDGATVAPGAILSACEGPIYLGKNAKIMAGALIQGPCAIGEGSTVKMGAKIYGDTTLGPVCKAGGEISNTVFHSYSNKAHDGYIGNSVVGQWCNFGAGTTVSNLKINYSNIRTTDWGSKEEIDTGQQFLGLIMGDHSKTAINCVINSGSVFGVNSNILTRDFPPKHIPSFSWVSKEAISSYPLEKAYNTMEAMMRRRKVPFTETYKELMEHIFENSRH